jgi:cysteine desulfurase/selenocysteine lyase
MGAAIDYVTAVGLERIAAHERDLLTYATQRLSAVDGLNIIGTAPSKASVVSFVMDSAHPHDIGTVIDRAGVAIRAGHHCALPLMDRLGLPATARASFGMYNTRAEADALAQALESVVEIFGR